jgi:redox-sensitive bicupin YhaK (pirin superfamily)
LFADVHLGAGTGLPLDAEHEERAIYVLAGEIEIGGDRRGPERLLVLRRATAFSPARRVTPTWSLSAAPPWMDHATSGGILFHRARIA